MIRFRGNWKNEYIAIGLIVAVKLVLMGFFSSDYQDRMFIPFLKTFLQGNDPYSFYYENQLLASFPYPPLMLFIEAFGGLLVALVPSTAVFWSNLLFKIPLLFFDLLGYIFIRRMNVRSKYALVFYFCSPIIIYSVYMHGQLDIIPTALLIVALYYLLDWKKPYNLLLHSVFLGLALSTKLHILSAVPILFLYILKKRDYICAIKHYMVTACIVLVMIAGFWGQGFINSVLFNKEQSVLFAINFDYGTTEIMIPILVLMMIYLNIFELNFFNKNLLVSVLGLLFAVFLICIPPMPAWFVWVVPFITIYFGFVDRDKYKVMLVYMGFNLVYVLYFVFCHQTEYVDLYILGESLQGLKMQNSTIKGAVFTIMVSCFLMVIYKIYKFGIASNSLYLRGNIPFTIGIAGDSGSGKSKLLEKIEHLFGTEKDILFIEGDGDNRWARNDENWEKYTALDPKANYLYRQAEDIRNLRSGHNVRRTDYDHDSGMFTEFYKVKPQKYIVLCGLHSLYLPQLRKELDLKIFMDTDQELRKYWKIQRDTTERGYSKEKIVSQIEKRLPDAEKYIYPQREYADIIITYFDKNLTDCFQENYEVVLSVKVSLDINLNLEPMLSCFREREVEPEYLLKEDFIHQEIVFDGAELARSDIDFAEIAESNIPQYEDFFTYYPVWGTGVEGVVQLLLLFVISSKMRR